MILDDVVSTMDARHRENVCKLLFEEFEDKQFIITTHDGIWFDQIKAAQRAYGLQGKFLNLNIIRWDLENGPEIRPYKPRWERIKNKINERDIHCAGNEGRRYLEWLLETISLNIRAEIPLNHTRQYTVGELLDPVQNRLNELFEDSEFGDKISQSFNNLEKNRMLGNLLSHNNKIAENVSIDEVERFCLSVHEIHNLMLCNKCKRPLKYYQDTRSLRCNNRRCSDPLEIKAK